MGEGGRQRDLQHALRSPLLLDDFAERLIDAVERFRHHRQDVPPGLGQHELLRTALEQGDAEKVLQHDHMTADRALGDRQAVGGGGEAEMLPGRLERSQRVERQPFAIHPTSLRRVTTFLADALERMFINHSGAVGQYDRACVSGQCVMPLSFERSRELVKLEIGRRRSPPRPATGARQRLAVDIEDVRHSAQRIEVDIAEQRPHVRRLAFPVLIVAGRSFRETGTWRFQSLRGRSRTDRTAPPVIAALPLLRSPDCGCDHGEPGEIRQRRKSDPRAAVGAFASSRIRTS